MGGITKLERERSAAEKTHRNNSRRMKELSSEIKTLSSKLNASSNPSEPLLPTRKRGVDDIELDEGMSNE